MPARPQERPRAMGSFLDKAGLREVDGTNFAPSVLGRDQQ